jgi:predicted dehydrogenase
VDKLRVGVIGVGWPGQRHVEAYRKHPEVEVVAIADMNTEVAESVRDGLGMDGRTKVFASHQELLGEDDVDAVSVCTPNYLHTPMVIDALDAGKHVLCEKPLASTLEGGMRIAERVAASDRVFMMGFNNRYRHDSRLLKSQIEAGRLGEIYYARTGWLRREFTLRERSWFTTREMSGGGPLIDLGVHVLDLTLWLMGNPRPVSVSGSAYSKFGHRLSPDPDSVDVEDLAAAIIKLEDGSTVVVEVSWVSYVEKANLVYSQLFGTQGGARIERSGGENDLRIFTSRDDVPFMETVPREALSVPGEPPYMPAFTHEVAHFVDCIKSGKQPESTVTHGLDVLRVLDAIYRSAETGEEVHLGPATDAGEEAHPGEELKA